MKVLTTQSVTELGLCLNFLEVMKNHEVMKDPTARSIPRRRTAELKLGEACPPARGRVLAEDEESHQSLTE
jgi:hypothetical protein